MITATQIYWLTRIENIGAIFTVMGFILCVFSFLYFSDDEHTKSFVSLAFCFLFFVTSAFIPDTKEIAAMYIIPQMANNKEIGKLPTNTAKLLNKKFEEWISDSLKNGKQ